ncbi:hypothetical protein GGR54DRAFT_610157 [Hypoxylon sp. NC1633]|nr:hypothetical protein GGR54DRAFT_610157 [Hypoxylon sp. NC1633]
MRPRQILTSLIIPTAALGLPTSPANPSSPRSPTASEPISPAPLAERDAAISCGLYKYAMTPLNPPSCWAWYAATAPASDYCGGSSFARATGTSTASSASWLDSCGALRAAELSAPRDFFLADYATDTYNTLLKSGSCALQVRPATPPSSDQIYVGGTDVADILGSAIAASRAAGGTAGVEGSMTCSPGVVGWRMVPV